MSEYRVTIEAQVTREINIEVDEEIYPDSDDRREQAEEEAAELLGWEIETSFPSTSVDIAKADAELLD